MSNITCSANNCVYNKGLKCHKRNINVVGIRAHKPQSTECINFTQGNSDHYSVEIADFNNSNASTRVSCTATSCTHNKRYLCGKKDLLVEGTNARKTEDTFCDSYLKEAL